MCKKCKRTMYSWEDAKGNKNIVFEICFKCRKGVHVDKKEKLGN